LGLVVDTSALVDLERSNRAIDDVLEGEPAVLPAIVLAELLVGVQLASTPATAANRRAKIDALTARLPIVDFGHDIAESWAELFAELTRTGALIPTNDLAVAATATTLGYDVLVGVLDQAHFRRVPGLGLRTIAV
jgi:predicted nucleic acid-binding protein